MPPDLADQRRAARSTLLDSITVASQRDGATALHLLGSLGRQDADAWSDIDAWLTFPDATINAAVHTRFTLYRSVGDLLLTHETVSLRPLGGVYTLALYHTLVGPMQVDWYLAPQRTSHVASDTRAISETVPIPRGTWLLDSEAVAGDSSLKDSIDWLIAMLFIAIKKLDRGADAPFLAFLGEVYQAVQAEYALGEMSVTEPSSLAAVVALLHQLASFAATEQRHAIAEITRFAHALA